MPSYVVLLRAVNIQGRTLKMDRARKALEDNGFLDVASHIQSGNLLLTSPLRSLARLEQQVGECLSEEAGFDVVALARRPGDLTLLVEQVDALSEGGGAQRRYVMFCKGEVSAEARTALEAWEVEGERLHVLGSHVVMELEKPFHQAKFGNARAERMTGLPATTRDIKVVRALAEKWGN